MRNPTDFLLAAPLLLISIIVHEVSHGMVADRLGDPTPRLRGRLTLDPRAHIDPMWTILVPGLLILSGSPFVFGMAKPVPINPSNFQDPFKGMALVGAAGPVSNLAMAFAAGLLLKTGSFPYPAMLLLFIMINIALAVFNLIPIPPLDGSRVLMALLPREKAYALAALEPYGFLMIILLFWAAGDLLDLTLIPIYHFLFKLFTGF